MAPMGRGAPPPIGMQGRNPIAEKKAKGKPKLSKAELETRSTAIIDEFIGIADVAEAATCFKELGAPKHVSQFVVDAVSVALDRKDSDRDNVVKLVAHFHEKGLLPAAKLLTAIDTLLPEVDDLAIDVPMVKKYLGRMVASLVTLKVLPFVDFVAALQKGSAGGGDDDREDHQLLGFTLQHLVESEGETKLAEMYSEVELKLIEYLPVEQQTEEKLLEFATAHGVLFLFALQSMQRQLSAELVMHVSLDAVNEGRGAAGTKAVRTWLQGQPAKVTGDDHFIFHVAVAVIGHVALSTTATPEARMLEVGAPEWKGLKATEGKMFEVLAPVLQALVMEDNKKQKLVVYSGQVWCHANGNPRGFMLRSSGHLYDLDVVEEPAFRAWREEVTDEFPGKANALIAINEYLNWMRTSEDETDSDDSDED